MANSFYWCNGFHGICIDSNTCTNCPYKDGTGGRTATPEEIMKWYTGESDAPDKAYQFDIDD